MKLVDIIDDYHPIFLLYVLLSENVQSQMKLFAAGAAQPKLGIYKLKEISVPFPPFEYQKKTANFLLDFDILINTNLRCIKVLEELAKSLYDEWFVRLRFPGHEYMEITQTEHGPTPKGWKWESLENTCEYISRGISPKYDENSNCRVINQRCIRENKINYELTRGNLRKVNPKKFVKYGDVLINSTGVGTLGRVAQVYSQIENHTVDSHVTIVRPGLKLNLDYLGLTLFDKENYLESLGVGATGQTELNKSAISRIEIIIPPIELQDSFSHLVNPIRTQIEILLQKKKKLTDIHDLLLPKLISGEIDISDIDIAV